MSATSTTQGTVRDFDESTGAGTAVRDDGTEVSFGPDAFAASGLRFLRQGQRIRWSVDDDGEVTAIAVVTFAL